MTLQTAKNKVKKAIKINNKSFALGLNSNYNTPLITLNNCKAKLNQMDGLKLSDYYNKLIS